MSVIRKNVWIMDHIEILKVKDTAYVLLGITSLPDFNYQSRFISVTWLSPTTPAYLDTQYLLFNQKLTDT